MLGGSFLPLRRRSFPYSWEEHIQWPFLSAARNAAANLWNIEASFQHRSLTVDGRAGMTGPWFPHRGQFGWSQSHQRPLPPPIFINQGCFISSCKACVDAMAKQLANKIGPSWHISNNRGNNMIDVVDGYTLRQHLNNKTFCEWRIELPNRNRFDPASQIQLAPQMRELPPKKIIFVSDVVTAVRQESRSGAGGSIDYWRISHQLPETSFEPKLFTCCICPNPYHTWLCFGFTL